MKNERLVNVDLIKITAAIAIVFHHYQQCFNVNYGNSILNKGLPYLGYFVELFFMISGFFAAKTLKQDEPIVHQYGKNF